MRPRLAAAAVAIALAWSGAATPTHASTVSPGCQEINTNASFDGVYWDLVTLQGSFFDFSTFPMFEGETIVVSAADPNPASMTTLYLTVYESFFTRVAVRGDSPGTIRYTLSQDLDAQPWVLNWGVADPAPGHPGGLARFTVECIPLGSGDVPAPQLQQVGRHADENCTRVNHDALTWGSDITGGWSSSWAQWPNDGLGGFVCTRTIAYRNGAWRAVA